MAEHVNSDVALGPDFLELRLRPLDDQQMRTFVRKWYALVERELNQDERLAAERADARAEARGRAVAAEDRVATERMRIPRTSLRQMRPEWPIAALSAP